MFENPDVAELKLMITGEWAVTFAASEKAQRLLAGEIERMAPVIMRALHNYDGYRCEYQASLEPMGDERPG